MAVRLVVVRLVVGGYEVDGGGLMVMRLLVRGW